jgi:hypothetical protein
MTLRASNKTECLMLKADSNRMDRIGRIKAERMSDEFKI